jgi:polysaccharide export outer membrane protein
MDRGIKRCFLITWFVSLVWGCGGVQAPPLPSSYVDAGRSQEIKELNSRLIAQGLHSAINPADYLIGPGDLLEIKVFESEKLTSLVRVSSRGEITLPLLGSVHVDGITARETEVKIENLLREGGYIRDPHVSVFVKEHRSKVVSVVGYVKEPGTYELIGRQTLLDVLAAAKGLDDKAGRTVYLTRTEEDGRKQAYIV